MVERSFDNGEMQQWCELCQQFFPQALEHWSPYFPDKVRINKQNYTCRF